MPQHDMNVANQLFPDARTDMNAAYVALASLSKGPSAPSSPYAGQLWVDDDTPSSTVWTIKQYDGTDWIEVWRLDTTNNSTIYTGTFTVANPTYGGLRLIGSSSDDSGMIEYYTSDGTTRGFMYAENDTDRFIISSDNTYALELNGDGNNVYVEGGALFLDEINAPMATGNTVASLHVRNVSGTGDDNTAAIRFLSSGYGLKLALRADGRFGIGGATEAPWSWYVDSAGNMVASGDVTAFSDKRLKKDIVPIQDALVKVKALAGVMYTDLMTLRRKMGLIADDVQEVVPEVVHDGDYKSLAYGNLVGLLIEAIKEIDLRLAKLEG